MSAEWWKHVDHDLSQLVALHAEINGPGYGKLPEVARRAMNVAYAMHFRTVMEFVHEKRPKREKPKDEDITSAKLLGRALSTEWTSEERARLADADKLAGHLSAGRVEREGMERDWGSAEDLALWAPYADALVSRAGDRLPRTREAMKRPKS